MNVEIGKYYERADGNVVGPVADMHPAYRKAAGEYHYIIQHDASNTYNSVGQAFKMSSRNLVAEVQVLPATQKILKVWLIKERRPRNGEGIILLGQSNTGMGTVQLETVMATTETYYTPEFVDAKDEDDDVLFELIDSLDDIPYQPLARPPAPCALGKINWALITRMMTTFGSSQLDDNTPYILTKDADSIFGKAFNLTPAKQQHETND